MRILTWHVHGSYLNALGSLEHEWFLPVKPGKPEGYGGRGETFDRHSRFKEVPADAVRDLDLDLVLFQSTRNLEGDQFEILSPEQRRLPRIHLEHNVPRPDAVHSVHPCQDPRVLLVHVTHYNRLMWDNGQTPTTVIEHSVSIDPKVAYSGLIERGITLINGITGRPRIAGLDVFMAARERVPLDIAGIGSETIGGLGDIPYRDLHRRISAYRFLFSPIRYTSLPLAVIEAMTIGMPVVALATTELPTVIEHGETGFVSCGLEELVECMERLLSDRSEAARIGRNAREVARSRFSMERFATDWEQAFAIASRLAEARVPVEAGR